MHGAVETELTVDKVEKRLNCSELNITSATPLVSTQLNQSRQNSSLNKALLVDFVSGRKPTDGLMAIL